MQSSQGKIKDLLGPNPYQQMGNLVRAVHQGKGYASDAVRKVTRQESVIKPTTNLMIQDSGNFVAMIQADEEDLEAPW